VNTVLVLQHVGCETLGTIADALAAADAAPQYIRAFAGQPVPTEIGGAAGLVVMGGPQSVYEQDRYPFLRDEQRLIADALRRELPVLGVCLGSQLLAATLGAPVTKGQQKEIGWYPVTLSDAAEDDALFNGVEHEFTGFHWHGDVFELPRGAVALAATALTARQAFRYGRNAYGLLFHMEVTGSQIAEMVTLFADELHAAGTDARAILAGTKQYLPTLQATGAKVYGGWAGLLAQAPGSR
jgi:GMP synthase (glutamine-hydrolysing)